MDEGMKMDLIARAKCPGCKSEIEIQITNSERVNNFMVNETRKIVEENRVANRFRSMRSWFVVSLLYGLVAMIIFREGKVVIWSIIMTCFHGILYASFGIYYLIANKRKEKQILNKEIKEMTGEN